MKKPMSKTKKIIYDILFLIALVVFLFSAYKLVSIYYLNYQEGKEKDAVQQIAKVPKNAEKEAFTIDWKALKEKNPEVVGWILIPDTDISYPIVQGGDNSYYLNHTFEKKENYAGAIFYGCQCEQFLSRPQHDHLRSQCQAWHYVCGAGEFQGAGVF